MSSGRATPPEMARPLRTQHPLIAPCGGIALLAAVGVTARHFDAAPAFALEPTQQRQPQWPQQQGSVGLQVVAGGPSPVRNFAAADKSGAGMGASIASMAAAAAGCLAAATLGAATRNRRRTGGPPSRQQKLQRIGRYGDPLMPWRIPNTSRWQWLSVRELLLRERILMITEYIDEQVANAYLAMLLYLQSEDATKPVQLYFAVPGTQQKPALALYDTICQLKARGCKVTTVAHGLCTGMGSLLVASGTPGRRFVTPNALFLLSQTGLESPFQGQAADIKVETMQMLRDAQRIEEEMASVMGQPVEKLQQDLSRNFYLSAEKAVEYGIVDRVLVSNPDKGKHLDEGVRDPWSGAVTKEEVGFGVFADPNQPRTAV